ncbi:MAG: amidohydrolase family protein [Chloroflexi bacterium]|nr:amidohydrolase family protein [Chloroflexota bacterium]
MLDLLVRGGTVVTPGQAGQFDIAVRGEKIAAVALPGAITEAARQTLDATGKVVVPGGVEPHAHLASFIGTQAEKRSYTIGPEDDTRGMAFGGTTTHIDFCYVRPGMDFWKTLEERAARWKGQSHIDYSFHIVLTGAHPFEVFENIPEAIRRGFPSFKVFTLDVLPRNPERPTAQLDFGRIQIVMEKAAANGGIVVVHAEDHDLVQTMYERVAKEGRMEGWNLPVVHNKTSELLSFRRTIQLAGRTGAAVYFVHTSAREGVEAVSEARSKGQAVYAETLHHYVTFDAEDYKKPKGYIYHTYPSLKHKEDREALWNGLLHGDISTVGTDEYPTTLEVKLRGNTVADVTGGNLGAEARVGITYTEGVVKRGMSLQRFAEVTSTNAARILGLYPRKGAIAPGSDADITVIDPSVHKKLTKEDFHLSDYSPWEGWEVQGWPVTTVLRGKVIVDKGRLLGSLTDGQLMPRKIDPAVLKAPVC